MPNPISFYYKEFLISLWLIITSSLSYSQSTNQNYVRTREPRAYITTDAYLDQLTTTPDSLMTTIQYIDGLGRPIQTVQYQSSPNKMDIVTPQAYDVFGREAYKYLPYIVTQPLSDGSYKTDALNGPTTGVFKFYKPAGITGTEQTNGVPVTAYPYAQTGYEPSPLNRVVEQSAPGESYVMTGTGDPNSTNHTARVTWSANDQTGFNAGVLTNNPGSHKVPLYTATINADGSRTLGRVNNNTFYDSGQLYITITRDENWQPGNGCIGTTEEFKDKDGRVILKRTYDLAAGVPEMLSTFYVYDDLGNLCFVLPPGAKPDMNTAITDNALKGFCYLYRYDQRNRLTQKRLPGQGWQFMVYNTLDQQVMTQNGNQRNQTPQQWTFTKYDAQGRPIITGLYNYTGSTADTAIHAPDQTELTNLTATFAGLTQNLWENPLSTTATGYDGLSYPTGQNYTFLTVNYYDSYTGIPGLPAVYDQHTNTAYNSNVQGLMTASKTYVLNSTDALWMVTYYDKNWMPARVFKQHYLGGTTNLSAYNYDDIVTGYNFVKQPLSVIRSHYNNAGTSATLVLTATDTYQYDHRGRLTKTWQQLKDHSFAPQAKVLLVVNAYNPVGQLIKKSLHSLSPFTSFLQSVNYRYTPRGWMSSINNASLANDAGITSNDSNDQFGEELYYDNTTTGIPQYNGNISSVKWKSGSAGSVTPSQYGYDYRYDAINRIIDGVSLTAGLKDGMFNEHIAYSNMGNITALGRYDNISNNRTQIDSLTYTYSSNRLLAVSKAVTAYTGTGPAVFNDGINVGTEYLYDINGNMIRDKNQAMITTYNLLNLPQTVTKSSGNTVVYVYDAAGTKLRKIATAGSTISTTEYIDGIEYDGTGSALPTISFLQTEEGRARWNGSSAYVYEYDLKDHLGNTRVTLNADGSGNPNVLQENSYYPFGATIASLQPLVPSPANHYLYNHKELQTETNLYDYGARFYDPVIARWTAVDPLAEKYRRWSIYNYGSDNPVRNIDPDGMDTFDINGHLISKDNTGVIHIQTDKGTVVASQLNLNKSKNLQAMANIAGYYAKNMGYSTNNRIGASIKNPYAQGEEKNGEILAYTSVDHQIFLNGYGGHISSSLDNENNLQSTLFHEHRHDVLNQGGKPILGIDHAQVYEDQISDKSFDGTTQDFKEGTVGGLILQLSTAMSEGSSIDEITDVVDKVNNKLSNYDIHINVEEHVNDGNTSLKFTVSQKK